MVTIREALTEAARHIAPASDSAGFDAALLLCAVLDVDRAYLYAHPEAVIADADRDRFAAWVARAAVGEPIAYLLGRRAFYDRDFVVTPAVLVPRPETELLIDAAFAWLAAHPDAAVAADIGTGSGALAVTLAAHHPALTVHAVDRSHGALAIARHNAALHGVRVTFWQGDLIAPLRDQEVGRIDLLLANLPYIPSAELESLPVARHEPHLALDGGADGLALVRRLIADLPAVMASPSLALLEIGAGQGEPAIAAAHALHAESLLEPPSVQRDYAGHDRVLRLVFR